MAVSIEPLWRATILFRIVALAFAGAIVGVNRDAYDRAVLAWAALAVMAAWTAFTSFRYAKPEFRRSWLAIADVVLTSALQYSSVFILSEKQLHSSFPTITTVWTCGPVIVAGALGGRPAGLVAGMILSLVNVMTRGFLDADMGRDAVLLIGLGFLIGQVSATTRQSAEHYRRVLQLEAATAERERLARSIHDGVLQVLARVSRRGAELGGRDAELGRIAAEQEIALRALVAGPMDPAADGTVDVSVLLKRLATPTVQVSAPASPVLLPSQMAGEVAAVVCEALSNVTQHAGPDARAWVLLEDLESEIALSVRDDGPGIQPGRLGVAQAEGRMGVAKSMRGRVKDLGGSIELSTTTSIGTEWEIRMPKPS